MFRYIIRRFLFAIPILLIASILVFLVVRSTVDPVAGYAVNPRVSTADLARLRREFGLDKSLFAQYTTTVICSNEDEGKRGQNEQSSAIEEPQNKSKTTEHFQPRQVEGQANR